MPKIITARFRINGVPTPGLSPLPIINIYQVVNVGPDVAVIVGASMVDIGNGWYKYVFTEINGFDPFKDFIYDADGGVAITSPYERYLDGACCAPEAAVNATAVWEADASLFLDLDTMGGKANAEFANVEQLLINLADVKTLIQLLTKYSTNRTRIDSTAFTLTVYDNDGTTPLEVFNLKDGLGNPSVTEVCERDPV